MVVSEERRYIVHPHKFNMWLFIITLIMVFGGLTSGYIVDRAAAKDPLFFHVPQALMYSTFVVLLSSVPVQFAVWKARQGKDSMALFGLLLGLALGVIFMVLQWDGLKAMTEGGLPLIDPSRKLQHGDSSVAFFYVFVGLHGAHLLGSILALAVTTVQLALDRFRPGRKVLAIEITATFWHFLGLLWLYLYLFIEYTQKL